MGHQGKQRVTVLLVAAAAVCLGTACDENDDGAEPPRLGNGAEVYYCIETADISCDGMSPAPEADPSGISPLPILGVGSRFDFDFGVSLLTRDRIVADTLGGYEAKKEGFAPMVGSDDDYFHVRIAPPDALVFTHETEEGSGNFDQPVGVDAVGLRVPEDRLRVLVTDADDHALAGLYPTNWSTSNDAVVSLVGNTHASVVTFRINGAGAATLTAEVGELSLDINFNITAAP